MLGFETPLARLVLALAIGLLVGVERGWRARDVAAGGRTAGIRTFALTGVLGGLAGLLSQPLGGWAFATLGAPFAAAFIWFKRHEQAETADHSVTTVVAALLVFALGAYATLGDGRLAAGTAVVVAALLAFKETLHRWLQRLTQAELHSALAVLAIGFVALPLLPDEGYGPYGAVNPFELGSLTLLLAGVSFLAYALAKILGPARGLLAASVTGALVSSTAVTLNLAHLVREDTRRIRLAAGGALLAGAVMAIRILAVAAVAAPALVPALAPPLTVFALASCAVAACAIGRRGVAGPALETPLRSPFDMALVLKLALVLGLVMAAARLVTALYGAAGVLPLSALAGLVDVDAVVLATSRMTASGELAPSLAVQAVLLAAAIDSLSKSGIALAVGGRRFGALFAAGTAGALALAATAYIAGMVFHV